mgnify:CR=1 FL=1
MKRVGRWTWMLLTLLLLLCTTAFAKTIECGSIELEQPVEVTFESYNTLQYTLTAPIDGMRVKVEWLSENENDAWLTINNSSASSTDGIFTLNKENTIKRRNKILKDMYEQKLIRKDQYQEAINEEIKVKSAQKRRYL